MENTISREISSILTDYFRGDEYHISLCLVDEEHPSVHIEYGGNKDDGQIRKDLKRLIPSLHISGIRRIF